MGNDGFDDDFYKIFKKYKLDFMDELNLREEVQSHIKKRFVSKDKIKAKIDEIKAEKDFPKFADYEWNDTEKILFHQADILDDLLKED